MEWYRIYASHVSDKKLMSKMYKELTWYMVQWLRIHLLNEGDMGSVSGQETEIPHAMRQLSPCAATTEPTHPN